MEVQNDSLEELICKNQIPLSARQKRYLKLKRGLDFVISLLALAILSPLLLIIAVVIKLDSIHEKVIFRQERVGIGGKPFLFYKFRSMKSTAPSELSTTEFVDAENYITRVGRFLRRTSMDELPQLFNILLGQMSLIGPRPLVKSEDEMHFLRIYYGLYQVRPGLTGLAQVNGRDAMDNYSKVRWERTYVRNIGFQTDWAIFWRTVGNVLKSKDVVDGAAQKRLLLAGKAAYTREEYNADVGNYLSV